MYLWIGSLASVPIFIYTLYLINTKKIDFLKSSIGQNKKKEFAVGGGFFFISIGELLRTTNNMPLYFAFGDQAYKSWATYLSVDLRQSERFLLSDNLLTLYPKDKNQRTLLIKIGDITQDSKVISELGEEIAKFTSRGS